MLLLVGILFLVLDFFHGVFSSGFVPILHDALDTQGTLAMAIYYLGLAFGQLAIYFYAPLSRTKYNYPMYEMAFGGTLILMAFYSTPTGLILGRLLEGIAGGMTTPLIFASLIKIDALGPAPRRIALFNSILALGYVMGPLLVAYPMHWWPTSQLLWVAGLFFVIMPMILFFLPVPKPNSDTLNDDHLKLSVLFGQKWFHKFYPLFLFKCVMGFTMSFATGYITQYITSIPLTQILFAFSIIFILGQISGELILKRVPKSHLETYVPLILATCLTLFFFTTHPIWIAILAFFLSLMALVGYLSFGFKATSAREFALFNSLSDPAMALGAALAFFGITGVWGLIPLLIYPVFHAWRLHPSETRAEFFYPFVGPIIMYKTIKKQKSPVLETLEDNHIEDLNFEYTSDSKSEDTLSFIFTGDLCPTNKPLKLSQDLKDKLNQTDFRFINLEGPLAKNGDKGFQFGFKKSKVTSFLKSGFNVINIVNNHILDQGKTALENTLSTLKEQDLASVTSELNILECKGLKIGVFGLTFGSNFVWNKDSRIQTLKPQRLLNHELTQTIWEEKITQYKEEVDPLIMSYHWGYEAEAFPHSIQKECFDLLQGFGVDVLYGHHAHIVQPFEVSGNAVALYSCGNFSTKMAHKIYQQGACFELVFNTNKELVSVKTHFIEHTDQGVQMLPKETSLSYNLWASLEPT